MAITSSRPTCRPPGARSIFLRTQMCSARVIVSEITFTHRVQVISVQRDTVSKTLRDDWSNGPPWDSALLLMPYDFCLHEGDRI
jgi:hypothetical protein